MPPPAPHAAVGVAEEEIKGGGMAEADCVIERKGMLPRGK